MSARQFPARLGSFLMQYWPGLSIFAVLAVALLLWTVHFSGKNWNQVDAQQWNRWVPSSADAAIVVDQKSIGVPYKDVHYRIERDYEHGRLSGIVALRMSYESEVSFGPNGLFSDNGWFWRIGWMLRQGLFNASSWQDPRFLSMDSYRSEQRTYEYICPSQEFRLVRSQFENDLGMRGTRAESHTRSSAGWTNGIENWAQAVTKGEPLRLRDLALIWPRLCRQDPYPAAKHFSFELNEQREEAIRDGRHRTWMPLPDEIEDPANFATDASLEAWPMEVCAEESVSGRLSCRLWVTGDDTARHALLLEPGTYRFFQRYYSNLPESSCGPGSRCKDTTRWYWRTHTHAPVEITLNNLGPGTSVGPQIAFFDLEEIEHKITWAWPAPGRLAGAGFGVTSSDNALTIVGRRGDPIVASADGDVVFAGPGPSGYGNLIIIRHNDTHVTNYAHIQTLLVKENQTVRKGQKIATMGSTGTDRVKLYFEIRRNGKRMNPALYLTGR